MLILFLWLFVQPSTPTEKKDFVQAVGVLLAALAGLGGLYLTWQGQKLTRENTERQLQEARKNTERQLQEARKNTSDQLEQARESQVQNQRLTEQGQITDRFTRAIDQLGKVENGRKLFEIRVGGIYALERIARESKEDYWPIMEILTAYVRQHALRRLEEAQQVEEDATVEKKFEENSRGESEPTEVPAPAADIQAIMTVIRRRTGSLGQGEPERLDLHETNLSGADLSKSQLSKAKLSEAKLSEAYLWGASFALANLRFANLSNTNLSKANLPRVDLSGADLSEANLLEANLLEANLSGADLSKSQLSKANLWGATVLGANLSGADLSEAEDYSGAGLEETIGDETTRLPPDLKPPAHWIT
jgi:uncharacterized protein YjbI with pentapeptide repeats